MVFEVKQACLCCCAVFLTQNRPSHPSAAHAEEHLVNMTITTHNNHPLAEMNSNAQKQFYVRIRQLCTPNSDQYSSIRGLVNQELGSQTGTTSCSLFEPKLSS